MKETLEKLGFECENVETGLLREEHPFYVPVWLLTRSVVERTDNLWVFSDYFEMTNWLNIKYAALTVIADEWRGQEVHAIHASGETLEATTGVLHEFESFGMIVHDYCSSFQAILQNLMANFAPGDGLRPLRPPN